MRRDRSSTTVSTRAGTLNRRESLRRGALLLGGVIFWPAALTSGASALKMAKDAAGYQDSPKGDQRCSNCVHFDAEQNACNVVEGDISAQAWCQLWTAA